MKKWIFIAGVCVLAMGCGNQESEVQNVESKKLVLASADELLTDILILDSALIESQTLEGMVSTAEEQLEKCQDYLDTYPMAPNKPTVYLKAGSACRALKQPEKALIYLNKFLASYKDHEKRDEALFTKAFILDEDLDRKDDAKDTYTQLIQEHPGSVFKQNAELLLEQLYLTDAELIEKFRKQNAK